MSGLKYFQINGILIKAKRKRTALWEFIDKHYPNLDVGDTMQITMKRLPKRLYDEVMGAEESE